MGYGLKPPGFWGGKKNLTWRQREGKPHPELERAFDIWQQKVGVTFTCSTATGTSVDFEVKTTSSATMWSPAVKLLMFKGTETLGTTLHEVGHLLGLSHEHDRPDQRATWYHANPGNQGEQESIRQAAQREGQLQKYGNYDSGSIMQYPSSKYLKMTEPSAGDVDAVKQINTW